LGRRFSKKFGNFFFEFLSFRKVYRFWPDIKDLLVISIAKKKLKSTGMFALQKLI